MTRDARPIDERATPNPLSRPKIIFQPAVAGVDGRGLTTLRPKVTVTDDAAAAATLPSTVLPTLAEAPIRKMPIPAAAVAAPQPSPRHRIANSSGDGPTATNRVRSPQRVPQPPPPRIDNRTQPPEEELPVGPMVDSDWVPPDPFMAQGGPAPCGDCVDDEWMPPVVGPHGISGGPLERVFDGVFSRLTGPPCYEGALGVERVMHAPFFIDTTQPMKNQRVRFDFAWDQEFPDRAEYFWKSTPMVQADDFADSGEPSVDYQDIRFFIERGTDKFSVATELPLRIVDPDVRSNTGGLGDMNVTTKAVLLNGRNWQISQLFRSYFPTGSFRRGTGNGHVSFEPGVAYRYKWSDITYFHGDLKYWFPVGADPDLGGQFLNYGFGVSHVAIDGDGFAVIPTLELVAWTVLDGAQTTTLPGGNLGPLAEVDNMSIVNIAPGVRFVWDNGHDCGTRELGISSGIAVSDDHWYEGLVRIDLRWSF